MNNKNIIKFLVLIIFILCCFTITCFINNIKTIKKLDNKIDELQEEITLKEIEINDYKEIIYQYKLNNKNT